jgi:hypothetical protein
MEIAGILADAVMIAAGKLLWYSTVHATIAFSSSYEYA